MHAQLSLSAPSASRAGAAFPLSAGQPQSRRRLSAAKAAARRLPAALAEVLSRCVGQRVSPRRALAVLHAETAWMTALLLGGSSLGAGACLMGWAAASLWLCRRVR